MRVRIYHDAIWPKPRSGRHARAAVLKALRSHAERELDQRWARNMMLNKWLEYCVERGHRFSPATGIDRGRVRCGAARRAHLMKALRQLGFLKLNFPPGRHLPMRTIASSRCSSNRAELKKAYGELQDEIYRLKDRIKQQEGATQRVQEMLGALETRLGAPESGYPALVFYQLRRLWQSGRELIEQFVADLARQQEERERRAHFAEHNRRQFARRQAVEAELRAAETSCGRGAHALAELASNSARGSRASGTISSGASSISASLDARRALGGAEATLADGARGRRGAREGSAAGISRPVGGGAPRHQSRRDRLRRSAVPAPGARRRWSRWRAKPPRGAR